MLLTEYENGMRAGALGDAPSLALEMLISLDDTLGVERMVPITQVQTDNRGPGAIQVATNRPIRPVKHGKKRNQAFVRRLITIEACKSIDVRRGVGTIPPGVSKAWRLLDQGAKDAAVYFTA